VISSLILIFIIIKRIINPTHSHVHMHAYAIII